LLSFIAAFVAMSFESWMARMAEVGDVKIGEGWQ